MKLGHLWRRYETGVEVFEYSAEMLCPECQDLVLWYSLPTNQYPQLNRWEGLDAAFIGFVSRGLAAPHACVYEAEAALRLIHSEHLGRTWIRGADAAASYNHLLASFIGVWLGNKTPYFFTKHAEFSDIIKSSFMD